jgi:hypothetical protein
MQVKYNRQPGLKTVWGDHGRCNLASSLFGLDRVDLRLRARSLSLGPDTLAGVSEALDCFALLLALTDLGTSGFSFTKTLA